MTPQPAPATGAPSDVPQDSSTGSKPASGPNERQVEAAEPPVDQLTDAQLQAALDQQAVGLPRLRPDLEKAAAEAAWHQVQLSLTATDRWTDVKQRAAVALLIGQHTDLTRPVPVNVITTWSGTDTEGGAGVHRAEIKLLYHSTVDTWRPVN